MAFAPGKPNAVPPDVRFGEWIDLLADMNDYDKRRLARWLAGNGIEIPDNWNAPERVIVGA